MVMKEKQRLISKIMLKKHNYVFGLTLGSGIKIMSTIGTM
jgi:hypothetical protein